MLNLPDSDSRAVFVLFVGFEFVDDLGVGEVFSAVGGDIPVMYDVEGVGAFNTLQLSVANFSYDLAEATKIV